MGRGMLAKALMEIGDLGMRDALQRRQQDEQGERRLMEMSVQDQIARDRQEWMDQRAEAKRTQEGERFNAESDKIRAGKAASANAEFDTAKGQLESKFKGQDLTMYVGELEKNRAEFISSIKLSGRERIEAMNSGGLLNAKEYTNALISQEKDDTANKQIELREKQGELRHQETMKRLDAAAARGSGKKEDSDSDILSKNYLASAKELLKDRVSVKDMMESAGGDVAKAKELAAEANADIEANVRKLTNSAAVLRDPKKLIGQAETIAISAKKAGGLEGLKELKEFSDHLYANYDDSLADQMMGPLQPLIEELNGQNRGNPNDHRDARDRGAVNAKAGARTATTTRPSGNFGATEMQGGATAADRLSGVAKVVQGVRDKYKNAGYQ